MYQPSLTASALALEARICRACPRNRLQDPRAYGLWRSHLAAVGDAIDHLLDDEIYAAAAMLRPLMAQYPPRSSRCHHAAS